MLILFYLMNLRIMTQAVVLHQALQLQQLVATPIQAHPPVMEQLVVLLLQITVEQVPLREQLATVVAQPLLLQAKQSHLPNKLPA